MPSANTEDLRRKFLVVQQQRSAPPNLASETLAQAQAQAQAQPNLLTIAGSGEPERTYVFPGTHQLGNAATGSMPPPSGPGIPGVAIITSNTSTGSTLHPGGQTRGGHARSVSHGGGAIVAVGAGGRPIKSAMKGHQRAFSQGQITDSPPGSTNAPSGRGHSRVGSKTDFILPPGHKDEPVREREFGPSAPSSATGGRGHSRQASRSESIYTLRRTEAPPWWKRFTICNYNTNNDKFEERSYRMVVPNHTVPPKTPKREHPNGHFVGNKIRTTKYTLLSFIPKNLLEQFHRVANLYFIFIVLLNWVPAISAFGKEVAMIPVLFVLGVTAVKDLFEDRRRRASDKRINNTTCRVYDG